MGTEEFFPLNICLKKSSRLEEVFSLIGKHSRVFIMNQMTLTFQALHLHGPLPGPRRGPSNGFT